MKYGTFEFSKKKMAETGTHCEMPGAVGVGRVVAGVEGRVQDALDSPHRLQVDGRGAD